MNIQRLQLMICQTILVFHCFKHQELFILETKKIHLNSMNLLSLIQHKSKGQQPEMRRPTTKRLTIYKHSIRLRIHLTIIPAPIIVEWILISEIPLDRFKEYPITLHFNLIIFLISVNRSDCCQRLDHMITIKTIPVQMVLRQATQRPYIYQFF